MPSMILEPVSDELEQFDGEPIYDLTDTHTTTGENVPDIWIGEQVTYPPVVDEAGEAERVFRESVRAATDFLAERALAKLQCEKELKAAKRAYDAALAELKAITIRGPVLPSPVAAVPSAQTAEQPGGGSDDWRAAYIEVLNLPASLAEKLAEAGISNMGQLEDFRAKVYSGEAKWPKGIGAAKVTKIEDATLEWLSANMDPPQFDEAIGETQIDPEPVPVDPSEPFLCKECRQPCGEDSDTCQACRDLAERAIDNAGDPEVTTPESLPQNPDRLANRQRAGELRDRWTKFGWALNSNIPDSGSHQQGCEAFNRGDDLTSCPIWEAGPSRDSWLLGWMYQNAMGAGATNGEVKPKRARGRPKKAAAATP